MVQVKHALYRFFDPDGNLLYVGITNHPDKRFRSHRGKDRWQQISRIDIEWHDSREAALAAERLAIRAEQPRWNVVFNGTERSQPKPVGPSRSGLWPVGVTIGLATTERRKAVAHIGAVLRCDFKTVTIRTPEGDEKTLKIDRISSSRIGPLDSVQAFKADWEAPGELTPAEQRRIDAFVRDPRARGAAL